MPAYADMPQIGSYLKVYEHEGTNYVMKCYCGNYHTYDKRWTFKGSPDSPSFTPSMKVQPHRWNPATEKHEPQGCCHFFVTNGKIEFCDDCTHEFSGQTLPMIPWEKPLLKRGAIQMRLEVYPLDNSIEVNEPFVVMARVLRKDGTVVAERELPMAGVPTAGRLRRLITVQAGAKELDGLLSVDILPQSGEVVIPEAEAFQIKEL